MRSCQIQLHVNIKLNFICDLKFKFVTVVMRESSSISPIWSSELMIWDKHFRGSLRERQRRVLHIASIEATQLLRSNWLLHYVWSTSGSCTQGVALLLTSVGADCCGLKAPSLLALCPLLHSFRWFGVDAHPQVLLRSVSPPVHNDEIACHIIVQADTIWSYLRNDQWASSL